jgi:hypothetical protein
MNLSLKDSPTPAFGLQSHGTIYSKPIFFDNSTPLTNSFSPVPAGVEFCLWMKNLP